MFTKLSKSKLIEYDMNREQISAVRRAKLKEWTRDHPIPEKEKSYFSQLINGTASFGEKAARRLETDYKMGLLYLDTPGQEQKQFETQSITTKNYPRVVGTARMGDKGYYLDLEGGDGYIEFEAEKGSIAIQVRGDSMFPAIRDGWYIIIEPSGQLSIGEYVLLKFKDERKMVKELLQIKSDSYVVMSVNGEERFTVMKEELVDVKAISAVVPPSKHKEH